MNTVLKKPIDIDEWNDFHRDIGIDLIENMARESYNIHLSYKTAKSGTLEAIDLLKEFIRFVRSYIEGNKDKELVNTKTIMDFGQYYGEIFMLVFGGEWRINDNKGFIYYGWPEIVGWTKVYGAAHNPFGAMRKVFLNRDVTSIKWGESKFKHSTKFSSNPNDKDVQKLLNIINNL